MTTYATMRTRITDELVDSALTTAQINSAIKTAIRHYQREPFWFNTKVGTFSTVVDQELYSSSDLADIPNIVRIDSMRVTQAAATKAALRGIDNNWIEEMQDGSVKGEPEKFSYYASKIRFYPIPSSVQTITISYICKLTELSADGDTNAWTDECEELIRQAAKRILCMDINHDEAAGTRYRALEQEAYDKIKEENRTRSSQQQLRVNWPFTRPYFDVERGSF